MHLGRFSYMDTAMKDVSLKIIDVGGNGDGIAHLENGATVFVPFAAKGDIVMADIVKDHDGQCRAKINSVLLSSPDRAKPPCRHFGICGGCSLQHLNASAYQSFKKNEVLNALKKHNVDVPENIQEIFIPDHTRRRANFAARVNKGKAVIGFHERKSANIRDVPDCLLINENVRTAMEALRPIIPQLIGNGEKIDILIQCVDGQTEIALTGKLGSGWEVQQALSDALRATSASRISIRARDYESYEILLEEKPYYKRFDSLLVNLAPGSFLQPSDEGERALVDCVIGGAGDASCVADLFCGNGTFTGPLMNGRKIIAADNAPGAIASLSRAGIDARVRNLFKEPLSARELNGVDCVVLDPPRAGALEQVRVLADTDVPKIVYVSCSPQSFARDAALLAEGGYRLEKLTIVDQFIWSTHTEVVGVFSRP